MSNKLISQGAEAKIFLKENKITKQRTPKSYRLKELDEKIRKLRTRSEFKIMEKASKIISIPSNLELNENKKEIYMDFINGKKLSQYLDTFKLSEQKEIINQIGISIAKLHDANIIHGDLTTSNIILVENEDNKENIKIKRGDKNIIGVGGRGVAGGIVNNFKIYLIDFGLGFQNGKIEDKAVDIHLLRQALEAKHFKHWEVLFNEFIKSYSNSKDGKKVLERFKKVESRGRYKEKY
ncbi:MAG: RIO1 family regulatory kinase/ATPase [Nanoarchaeota archaeon]|nr:RIO1 family regulatory kinase/ATPase [Nanoarchaeota archaeon]